MAAHSYHQNPVASASNRDALRRPAALKWVLLGSVVSVVLLVALPTLMIIDRDTTIASILRDRPDLASGNLGFAFGMVIAYTVALHAIDAVLLVWFTIKVLAGRNWARIALSAYLVLATGFGLISATKGAQYLVVVIISDVIHLALLALLWLPASVRAFFAAHRAASTTTAEV